jgi:hypothetical protein
VLIGFNTGIYQAIDLSAWIAGNPVDVLATNFGSWPPCSIGFRARTFSYRRINSVSSAKASACRLRATRTSKNLRRAQTAATERTAN